ncbi:class I SAM-dependent methyltransferase [Arenibaculum sp.]|uniref:O-methyltransferase n=1 Tax=Arenibaculum sp. TaxID=2865862 RepID=UPI002E0D3D3F|nr:class I SAM-dependent methyltransferase [Arenibaculum sp.]
MSQILLRQLFPDEPTFGGTTHGMQGSAIRHLFMTLAVSSLAARGGGPLRMIEIGSWTGFSALTWAQAMGAFHPAGGSLTCIDVWQPYFTGADLAKGDIYGTMDDLASTGLAYDLFVHNTRFVPKNVRVDHFRGRSRDILPLLQEGAFDLVYIDGSHYFDDVGHDIAGGDRLLREGGILCGDDLNLQAHECDLDHAARSIEENYVEDPRTGQHFHPGVTLAVDRFFGGPVSAFSGFWAMVKGAQGYRPFVPAGAQFLVPDHFPAWLRQTILQTVAADPDLAPRAG